MVLFQGQKLHSTNEVQESIQYTKYSGPKKKITWHIIIKTISILNKERILKSERESDQTTYSADLLELHIISQWGL